MTRCAMERRSDASGRSAPFVLTGPNGGDVDLIADHSIRSGKIAAYLEMRDQVLVQAQAQLDQIAAGLARALSDQHRQLGPPVTPARSRASIIDISGLLAGNSVSRELYRQHDRRHSAPSRWCGSTIRRRCRCRTARRPIRTTRSIGLDFSGGMASIVSQINAALGATSLAVLQSCRQHAAHPRRRRGEQGRREFGLGQPDRDVAHRRHARAAVLSRRQQALYRGDHVGRPAERGARRPHRGQSPISSPTPRGSWSTRPRR